MTRSAPVRLARGLGRLLLGREEAERYASVELADAGHGWDLFGAQRDVIAFGVALLAPLYRYWFRVTGEGREHIPATGPVILAANHSGVLPYDAAMLWRDVITHTDPPRVVRAVADHFVPQLPFLGEFFARGGAVGGSRRNLQYLLDRGELVLIFPEGTEGIGKNFRQRYQLRPFRVGHVEFALRARAPIVPVAVIGPEEQMVQVGRVPIPGGLFGVPYLPVALSPLPLPVHYHIIYGEPVSLHEDFPQGAHEDPEVLQEGARRVQQRVADLIDRGLRARRGVFR